MDEPQYMDAATAIDLCKAGTAVRRRAWHREVHLAYTKATGLRLIRPGFYPEKLKWTPTDEDMSANDWHVGERPHDHQDS